MSGESRNAYRPDYIVTTVETERAMKSAEARSRWAFGMAGVAVVVSILFAGCEWSGWNAATDAMTQERLRHTMDTVLLQERLLRLEEAQSPETFDQIAKRWNAAPCEDTGKPPDTGAVYLNGISTGEMVCRIARLEALQARQKP